MHFAICFYRCTRKYWFINVVPNFWWTQFWIVLYRPYNGAIFVPLHQLWRYKFLRKTTGNQFATSTNWFPFRVRKLCIKMQTECWCNNIFTIPANSKKKNVSDVVLCLTANNIRTNRTILYRDHCKRIQIWRTGQVDLPNKSICPSLSRFRLRMDSAAERKSFASHFANMFL